jgi:2,3-bisphosphoglycerate-independent phosphoglycerate mutase
MNAKKVILIIMDGWGEGQIPASDAIQNAEVPFVRSLYSKYPHTTLVTYGESVGLPEGQMGNSEVGHLNIGAGRVVYQELQRINVAAMDGELASSPTLLHTLEYAQKNNKTLHLMGLVSDGGVHSHIEHIKALVSICGKNGIENLKIHAFTDGRDTDPKGGYGYLEDLQNHLDATTGEIATVIGRYYAMDRDKRWERVKLAYDGLVNGVGEHTNDVIAAVKKSYENNVTDEFIKPIIKTDGAGNPTGLIKEGDQ